MHELPACLVTIMSIRGRKTHDYFRSQRLSRRSATHSAAVPVPLYGWGAYSEYTLRRNVEDLSEVALRQRILKNMSDLSLETTLFNEKLSMPVALGPVGLCGMYARRGEVQAAKAADAHGIPFTLSTVSVCPIEEVAPAIKRPMWFQLYVLRDRGFMRNALERAKAAGCSTLVFTVDMPTPGARYRDAHSGMSGPNAAMRRYLQAVTHPQWAWDVGLNGRPHDLGNISAYLGKPTGLEDYIGWLGNNFDPSISWKDLEWIRDFWDGPMVIKGSSIRKMRVMQYVLVLMELWFLTTVAASWTVCCLLPVRCLLLQMR